MSAADGGVARNYRLELWVFNPIEKVTFRAFLRIFLRDSLRLDGLMQFRLLVANHFFPPT